MSNRYTEKATGLQIKIAVIDVSTASVKHIITSFVPRIGDQVFMGYNPSPTVSKVVWHPNSEDFKTSGVDPLAQCLVFVE